MNAYYHITLKDGIATIGTAGADDPALDSLKSLWTAASVDRNRVDIVAKELKTRALEQIGQLTLFWESIVRLLLSCFGYKTTAQKIDKLYDDIIEKHTAKTEAPIDEKPIKPEEVRNIEAEELEEAARKKVEAEENARQKEFADMEKAKSFIHSLDPDFIHHKNSKKVFRTLDKEISKLPEEERLACYKYLLTVDNLRIAASVLEKLAPDEQEAAENAYGIFVPKKVEDFYKRHPGFLESLEKGEADKIIELSQSMLADKTISPVDATIMTIICVSQLIAKGHDIEDSLKKIRFLDIRNELREQYKNSLLKKIKEIVAKEGLDKAENEVKSYKSSFERNAGYESLVHLVKEDFKKALYYASFIEDEKRRSKISRQAVNTYCVEENIEKLSTVELKDEAYAIAAEYHPRFKEARDLAMKISDPEKQRHVLNKLGLLDIDVLMADLGYSALKRYMEEDLDLAERYVLASDSPSLVLYFYVALAERYIAQEAVAKAEEVIKKISFVDIRTHLELRMEDNAAQIYFQKDGLVAEISNSLLSGRYEDAYTNILKQEKLALREVACETFALKANDAHWALKAALLIKNDKLRNKILSERRLLTFKEMKGDYVKLIRTAFAKKDFEQARELARHADIALVGSLALRIDEQEIDYRIERNEWDQAQLLIQRHPYSAQQKSYRLQLEKRKAEALWPNLVYAVKHQGVKLNDDFDKRFDKSFDEGPFNDAIFKDVAGIDLSSYLNDIVKHSKDVNVMMQVALISNKLEEWVEHLIRSYNPLAIDLCERFSIADEKYIKNDAIHRGYFTNPEFTEALIKSCRWNLDGVFLDVIKQTDDKFLAQEVAKRISNDIDNSEANCLIGRRFGDLKLFLKGPFLFQIIEGLAEFNAKFNPGEKEYTQTDIAEMIKDIDRKKYMGDVKPLYEFVLSVAKEAEDKARIEKLLKDF